MFVSLGVAVFFFRWESMVAMAHSSPKVTKRNKSTTREARYTYTLMAGAQHKLEKEKNSKWRENSGKKAMRRRDAKMETQSQAFRWFIRSFGACIDVKWSLTFYLCTKNFSFFLSLFSLTRQIIPIVIVVVRTQFYCSMFIMAIRIPTPAAPGIGAKFSRMTKWNCLVVIWTQIDANEWGFVNALK